MFVCSSSCPRLRNFVTCSGNDLQHVCNFSLSRRPGAGARAVLCLWRCWWTWGSVARRRPPARGMSRWPEVTFFVWFDSRFAWWFNQPGPSIFQKGRLLTSLWRLSYLAFLFHFTNPFGFAPFSLSTSKIFTLCRGSKSGLLERDRNWFWRHRGTGVGAGRARGCAACVFVLSRRFGLESARDSGAGHVKSRRFPISV